MVRGSPRVVVSCVLAAALAGSVIALAAADDQRASDAAAPQPERVAKPKPAPPKPRALLASFDPRKHQLEGDHLVATLDAGAHAELTLDPKLQAHIEKLLSDYAVPYGALVAIEPSTGRVLAYVSHSTANPAAGDLVRDATPPSASVFKLITASALVDVGVGPETSACYGGGLSHLALADINDDPRRDRTCATLTEALGGSINAVFAKLADKHLDPATLRRYADAYGFGRKLPFDVETAASSYDVPEERLEFARTAAGFWHMHMSPLHAALIASTIAADGVMPKPSMIERVLDASGNVLQTWKPEALRTVIEKSTARTVGHMMLRTVTDGTARSAFYEHGKSYLPGIDVAGKTGSLSADGPYRAYSWWVGFAPANQPKIAVAALVVNTPKWRIKGSFLAREALREYLVPAATKRGPATGKPPQATVAAHTEPATSSAETTKH